MLVERDALFKLSMRGFTLRGYAYDETMVDAAAEAAPS